MKNKLIFILTFLFLLMPLATAAQDFAYNRLYSDGTAIVPGLNYSINVNHSQTSDFATLAADSLLFNDYSLFNYINGYVRAQNLVCFLSGGVDCTMSGNIIMGNNDITGVNDITGTGNIDFINPDIGVNILSLNSTNPIALSAIRAGSDTGSFASLVSIGSQFPGANLSANDSGIIAGGGRLIFVNNGEEDIAFAHVTSGDSNFSNASFSFRLDSTGNAFLSGDLFLEDDKKSIRTVPIDGGSAIVLDSNDTIVSGGFPVIEIARTSEGERVITRWTQNGRNNSFSGFMNSIGPVPRSWVNFTGETDKEGIEFLFNRSDYIKYCNYLQTNLSLIPEGCKYFADTTGRKVPLGFFGDLEVHRSATIHEGALIYNDFDYVTRTDNDFDISGGDVHIRKEQIILANVSFIDQSICDFNDGDICSFENIGTPTDPVNQWNSKSDPNCPTNAPSDEDCAGANGNLRVMEFSEGTQLSNYTNISFYYTTAFSGVGSNMSVTLNDNQGNTTTVFSQATGLSNQHTSFLMPPTYLNKDNVTMSLICDAKNNFNGCYVDDIRVFATFSTPIIINATEEQAKIIMGESGGLDECSIAEFYEIIENTTQIQKVMEIGCLTGETRFTGNVSFVDTIIENQTIIGELNVDGDAIITGDTQSGTFTLNGTTIYDWFDIDLDNKYFRVDGTSQMQGNANMSGNKVINVGYPTDNTDATSKLYVDTELSDYVPYTGATKKVDLGEETLEAGNFVIEKTVSTTSRIRTTGADRSAGLGLYNAGFKGLTFITYGDEAIGTGVEEDRNKSSYIFSDRNNLILTGLEKIVLGIGNGFSAIQKITINNTHTHVMNNLTVDGLIYGNGSQLSGITHTENQTLEEVLIEGNNGQGQNITNISYLSIEPDLNMTPTQNFEQVTFNNPSWTETVDSFDDVTITRPSGGGGFQTTGDILWAKGTCASPTTLFGTWYPTASPMAYGYDPDAMMADTQCLKITDTGKLWDINITMWAQGDGGGTSDGGGFTYTRTASGDVYTTESYANFSKDNIGITFTLSNENRTYIQDKEDGTIFMTLNHNTKDLELDKLKTTGGIYSSSTGDNFDIPNGTGKKFLWLPSKTSFRAGFVSGTQWDSSNIGLYSFAVGYDTKASGEYSNAFGFGGQAIGQYSTTFGNGGIAKGDYSAHFGIGGEANGSYSTHFGSRGEALGFGSTHFGNHGKANGQYSTHFGTLGTVTSAASTHFGANGDLSGGSYQTHFGRLGNITGVYGTHFGFVNTVDTLGLVTYGQYSEPTGGSPNSWVSSDPLVVFGDGTSGGTSNSRVIYKNGNDRGMDNVKGEWGNAGDFSTYYDGTNAIINPKEIGNGQLKVLGDLNVTESLYVTENITVTRYIMEGSGAYFEGNSTCAFIFYNSTGSVINTMGCS